MPKHTGRILQDPHINRDHRRIILNRCAVVTGLRVEQFAQLAEAGETPIALLGDEPVMCV
jgi:hypothetical protein